MQGGGAHATAYGRPRLDSIETFPTLLYSDSLLSLNHSLMTASVVAEVGSLFSQKSPYRPQAAEYLLNGNIPSPMFCDGES